MQEGHKVMSLEQQPRNARSSLCRFLNSDLPHRNMITQQWAQHLPVPTPADPELHADDHAWIGTAAELRIGLDLSRKDQR